MNVRTTVLPAFALLAALALPTPALAVQGGVVGTIQEILLTSSPLPAPAATGLIYGGCMVRLSVPINTATNSPNCPANWVAFSCDGTYATKDIAQMMLDQAQLAFTMGKSVYVVVDDTKLSNTFCTAVGLQLYR